jgi:hypothetical protein
MLVSGLKANIFQLLVDCKLEVMATSFSNWRVDGFVPDQNAWDALKLDKFVLHPSNGIDQVWQQRLNKADYLGYVWKVESLGAVYAHHSCSDYTLDRNGVCHRTHVAARTQLLTLPQWRKFVAGHSSINKDEAANELIRTRYIQPFIHDASLALRTLEVEHANRPQKDSMAYQSLIKRWAQMLELLHAASSNLAQQP